MSVSKLRLGLKSLLIQVSTVKRQDNHCLSIICKKRKKGTSVLETVIPSAAASVHFSKSNATLIAFISKRVLKILPYCFSSGLKKSAHFDIVFLVICTCFSSDMHKCLNVFID